MSLLNNLTGEHISNVLHITLAVAFGLCSLLVSAQFAVTLA